MMYYQALGYQSPAVSERIESLARWVQWAETAITSGATDNEAVARYNLTQFWAEKQPQLESMTQDELIQANNLDIRAHGLLVALDDALIYSRSPSYWEFWKSYMTGSTPVRPETDSLLAEAKQAAIDAAKGAQAAGHTHEAQVFSQYAATGLDQDMADANKIWKQPGINILGVPLWAWIVGGVALYVFVVKR